MMLTAGVEPETGAEARLIQKPFNVPVTGIVLVQPVLVKVSEPVRGDWMPGLRVGDWMRARLTEAVPMGKARLEVLSWAEPAKVPVSEAEGVVAICVPVMEEASIIARHNSPPPPAEPVAEVRSVET